MPISFGCWQGTHRAVAKYFGSVIMLCATLEARIAFCDENVREINITGGYLRGEQAKIIVSKSGALKHQGQSVAVKAGAAGEVVFWTKVMGDAEALRALEEEGALPVRHDWSIMGVFNERLVPTINIAPRRSLNSEWQSDYLRILRREVVGKGFFVSSTLSTGSSKLQNGAFYRVRLIGNNGKLLLDPNGRPYIIAFRYQQ